MGPNLRCPCNRNDERTVFASTDAYRFKALPTIIETNKRVRSASLSGQALVNVVGTDD